MVDRDHAAIEGDAMHNLVAKMLPSTVFRGLILLLIIANAIIIGIQTDERLVSLPSVTREGQPQTYICSIISKSWLKTKLCKTVTFRVKP